MTKGPSCLINDFNFQNQVISNCKWYMEMTNVAGFTARFGIRREVLAGDCVNFFHCLFCESDFRFLIMARMRHTDKSGSLSLQMKQSVKEQFCLFLSQKGLKATLQRNLILDAFLDCGRPVHLDELYRMIRSRHRSIGHATVYRALKLFAEAGIARAIPFGDGQTRFRQATPGGRRDYLVCSDCGTATEFENSSIEQQHLDIAEKHGFKLQTLKIELRGLCDRCLSSADGASL